MDQHALKVAAQNLIELMAQLKQVLLDHQLAISGFRPLSDSQPATRAIYPARLSESELSRLADQVCDLWISDKPAVHAAVLVCNEVAVLEMINQVNQAKTDLCHQIDRVKKQLFVEQERRVNPQASDLFLDAMSLARSEFLNKNRDNRFNAMVAKMGFAAMDFT
ncbi:hypothetical protein, partial [Thiomicrospira microaerophila]|uniref:hypothetical protein n=1 Tax=Thiomicrospira microaerophila TaxID=406020 RepID=UPI0005C951DC